MDGALPAVHGACDFNGRHAGQLDVRWQTKDARLGDSPITLQFSDDPNGPWSTIATGLPNSGQYLWQVDARTPRQIYLRLEVSDEAGNVASHELTEPIAIEGLTPQGRIRTLLPNG